jgi:hypothetical protein
MIVFLTGSSWQLRDDLPFLRKAVKSIEENGGVLARDWIEPTFERSERPVTKKAKQPIDWKKVMRGTVDAILRADVVIVEASSYRFSQGYQVALALQQKKPVLVISRQPNGTRSMSGIDNKLLTLAEYESEDELEKIIRKFMIDNTISTKDLRFNFFIDRQIYNYLRSVSYETGKNKSEIIRDLINGEIKRGDDK